MSLQDWIEAADERAPMPPVFQGMLVRCAGRSGNEETRDRTSRRGISGDFLVQQIRGWNEIAHARKDAARYARLRCSASVDG